MLRQFTAVLVLFFSMLAVAISSENISKQQEFNAIGSQLNKTDYQHNLPASAHYYSLNRDLFYGQAGKGKLWLQSEYADSVMVLINDQPLINNFTNSKTEVIDIGKHSKNGVNTIEITSITPSSATVSVKLPFPVLVDSTKQPEAAGFSVQKLNNVDNIITKEIAKGFPRAVLMVIKDNKIIKETAYGYQRKYSDGTKNSLSSLLPEDQFEAMTIETVFDLASNTKMYATNYAIMKLVSEQKLNIDIPITNYIHEYKGQGREKITTRDLLTHSAGYAPEVLFFDNTRVEKGFFSQIPALTKSLILTKVPLVYLKGTKIIYSDTGFILLGILVEKITGMPLDVYVEQEIYQPLELQNTMFNPLNKGIAKNQIAATELNGNSRDMQFKFKNDRVGVI